MSEKIKEIYILNGYMHYAVTAAVSFDLVNPCKSNNLSNGQRKVKVFIFHL